MASNPGALVRSIARWALFTFAVSAGRAGLAQDSMTLTLGTATPGGGFPVYGAAFAETVGAMDKTLKLETRNTKGSTENVPLLAAGKLDLALVQGEVVHEALANGAGKPAQLTIVAAMYSTPGMFVVRADSPYRTVHDLVGKPVAFGASGSGLVILARYVLDGMGLDQERDFQAIKLERAGDGPAMVLDGRVAALWGGGLGWPGFTAVANAPGGARFIAPNAEERKGILAKHDFLKPMAIPAGSFAGQNESVDSVGSWSFVLARPGLPDDAAYRVARALHLGEATIAAKLPQGRESTLANTLSAAPREASIHPGVLRYMRESGLLK